MKLLYFDCFSGASGDMILASLLDAGASVDRLLEQLATLSIPQVVLHARKIQKQGFSATSVDIRPEANPPARHLSDILKIIQSAAISQKVQSQATHIFRRLAEAEAAVHGCPVEKIHFHEVGAADAIADIVGSCILLEDLGIEKIECSPIPTGSGTVRCQHGLLPVPAPATAMLLKGVPLANCDEMGELTTPTGAAILTTLSSGFGTLPDMRLECVGYGAGRREGQHIANLLRALIGDSIEKDPEQDRIVILETNIDDQSPELTAHLMEELLTEGALDVFCHPIYMKKGRMGVQISVLCHEDRASALEHTIFTQSSTLGIRRSRASRRTLLRTHNRVSVLGGSVRVKVGMQDGKVLTISPEYEDCKELAKDQKVPLKHVMALANLEWHRHFGNDSGSACWSSQSTSPPNG